MSINKFFSFAYSALKYGRDGVAVYRAVQKKSARPLANRVGRRCYGKLTGRLAGRIFKP